MRQIEDFVAATHRLTGRELPERRPWNTTATLDSIRHFAYGTSDDNPLWLDPSYAAGTRFGRPVAPPAFLTSVLYPVLHGAPLEAPLSNLISELSYEWLSPVLEGDALRAQSKQTEVLETEDRNGKPLVCILSETRYWNQRDACVAKAACTLTRAPLEDAGLRVDRPVHRYRDDELASIGEAQQHPRRSGNQPLDPGGIDIGDELPPLVRGPMTIGDLVCWEAAIGPAYRAGALGYRDALAAPHSSVRHPITGWPVKDSQQHEDFLLAPQRGMPLPFDNGVMRFAWICPLLTDWMGDDGTLRCLSVRLVAPNLYGDTTWYRGVVTSKTSVDGGVLAGIRITGSNQLGESTTIGEAGVFLPLKQSRPARAQAHSVAPQEDRWPAAEGDADSLHALVRLHAARQPSKAAVISGERTMSYGELVLRIDRLAAAMRSRGFAPGAVVGVALERGADYPALALALFETGSTLLPLDAAYPAQRLKRVLDDADPCLVLTCEALRERIPQTQAEVVTLEGLTQERVDAWPVALSHGAEQDGAGYILYTSGSTGEPAGVSVPHSSLFRSICALPEALGVHEEDVFVHTASFAFSASMRQLFLPLCLGATVIVADEKERMDLGALFGLMKRRGATVWDTVPGVWRQAIDTLREMPTDARRELLDNCLRLILLTGEALTWDLPAAWRHDLEHPARVINLYSQTETAGTVACYCLPEDVEDRSGVVPLGAPVAGASLDLWDEEDRLVADGGVGEIVVCGRRFASGYLRRPDLTARKFIPMTPGGETGGSLYRTGDLGRRRADGAIEFAGRADDRLKLRGFRIEPNEIASALCEHPAVRQAAVIARTDPAGHPRLVAYVVPIPEAEPAGGELPRFLLPNGQTVYAVREGAEGRRLIRQEAPGAHKRKLAAPLSRVLSSAGLHRFAMERLPDYMLPSAFVFLPGLPRSPNGKIDRHALPDPDWPHPETGAEFSAPRTELERTLAALWAVVLGVERIGTEDDFLELGGDSIRAMQILNRIRKEFEVDLPAAILFSGGTVAALAREMESRLKPAS